MTFPIKKRINTELFIDKNIKLYILLVDKAMVGSRNISRKMDQVKIAGPLGERLT